MMVRWYSKYFNIRFLEQIYQFNINDQPTSYAKIGLCFKTNHNISYNHLFIEMKNKQVLQMKKSFSQQK